MRRTLRAAVVMMCLGWLGAVPAQAGGVVCASSGQGDRQHCTADTTAGVALVRETGSSACMLGKTWGYDDTGVWVTDGCGGEFVLGKGGQPGVSAPALVPSTGTAQPAAPKQGQKPSERIETWGEFEPGQGFLVGKSRAGELSISAYALVRAIDQLPTGQTYTDHLGNEHPVDTRLDLYAHRIMVFFKGWLGDPKFVYNIFFWTVNATDQDALLASFGYQFGRKFSLYAGINGLPGTRSVQGSHPFWLGHDRVMADEFFRPYFGLGLWAQGELTPGFWYNAMVSNNNSSLGIKATQLDRKPSYGASVWWTPTTLEFGPKGAFGDYEMHDKLATRFGVSTVYSPEERFTDGYTGATGNTTLRLADSLNVFDIGSLAPGVTVQNVNYQLLSLDAGLKYRGFFFQTEFYSRKLDAFKADGPLPVEKIEDQGFYIQAAFFPIPKKLELYGATSQIYGDSGAGFDNSSEYLVGGNWYPFDSRDYRLNVQVIDVNRSSVSSTFGYYTGGQDGTTVSVAFSIFF